MREEPLAYVNGSPYAPRNPGWSHLQYTTKQTIQTLKLRDAPLQPDGEGGQGAGGEGEPPPGQSAEEEAEGEREQQHEDPPGQGVLGEPDGEGRRGGNTHCAGGRDQGLVTFIANSVSEF